MSNFKVGQKVVCVDPIDKLIKGEIYTVRIARKGFGIHGLANCISLFEIKKEMLPNGNEMAFISKRFRPLDHQFAEDVIAMITEQVKEEELVIK